MEHDPTDIAGQYEQSEELREQALLAAQIEADDLAWLMSDRRGRRIVWRLLERVGVHSSSYSADTGLMAFNEGRRYVGLQLRADITSKVDPEMYITMIREAGK